MLNLKARLDRAHSVIDIIDKTEEYSRGLVRLRPEPAHKSFDDKELREMINRRLYVDRIGDHIMTDQEALARRAEILVLYAPGCAAAEIGAASKM